ncbi:YjzD family protein [Bacillus sp. EB600]|uniref:YjzD family protein n=1 Tax=Bacillus sp. EB600 TaxID=2806345 RepID=UPI00210DA95E|nr:YjzD family protein [Bacillus sp. EB600]MCQ6280974.1 YjzD family protein [Bacillus sp. EB600]
MRFFWSLFWGFLLVQMLTYVITSMLGTAYDFKIGSILALVVVVLVYAISAVIPNDPVEKH